MTTQTKKNGWYKWEVLLLLWIVKGKVDFPQIGLEKGTTERGIPKVSKSCQHYKFLSIF